MHAEKCPVCNGKGKIKKDDFKPLIDSEQCHGCNGRGWIEVQDNQIAYIPYYPQPYQPYTPYPEPYYPPNQPFYSPNTSGDYIVPQDAQISYC